MKNKLTKLLVLLLSLAAITCFALACTPKEDDEPQHVHAYSTEYTFDENNHWNECSCGDKKDVTAHVFVDGVCVCGYEKLDDGDNPAINPDNPVEPSEPSNPSEPSTPTHTHNYQTVNYDENNHWNECSCGDKKDVTAHDLVDGVCACGYGKPTEGVVYEVVGDHAKVSWYEGTSTKVVIEKTYMGLPVTSIGGSAFYNGSSLTSVTIPDGVTVIGAGAFSGCGSLTRITIPDSVTRIGDLAFSGCKSLQYNEYDNAYYLGNKNNKYVALIDAKSKDITNCTINGNCKVIYEWAFYNCSSLTEITIPDGVTYIGWGAFYFCKSLKSVTLPDSVTGIGDTAFCCCESLTNITIPDGVTSIGLGVFNYCNSLTSITVDDNNQRYKSIDGNLYSKDGKTLVQYAIGKKDTSFTIPDGVTNVGYYAFAWCSSLTSITIPDSVISIEGYVFFNCGSLTNITFEDANGWYVDEVLIDVADGSKNVTYFTSEYVNYNWDKNVDANNKG